ncbi:MAG: DEAD/DEAH box helicase [ANME-2 cluster archaeon]|nr:DEAD/DEAH box helicase [ANME-2 cluster archaeon]MBC2702722.1 DEAD/DEAH box helicase [ANME-2 cluster archaeon]MBC2707296.1 DEAD/DEAH box helicase [ANME-2 cluster archaeon]MBC2747156.1 DEAD/DEAH box helicase [ANME-2 cluster archaeon]MBC2761713.1 DEAD/DEAH box helicase [ANME-2 cluster archaeon]
METHLLQQDTDKQTTDFITHPLIKPDAIEQRLYQLNLAAAALKQSTLVVLPTGLGKTIVALIVIANRLQAMSGKVIILSPTKPLVEQHASFLKKFMTLPPDEIVVFTGSIPSAKRIALWKDARIVVSTPQVIENDLLSHRIDLSDVVHITFDEAHRSVGNYAYVYIAEKYQFQAKDPLVLGITASPGASSEKIEEVCRNLSTSKVQVRTDDDPDVKPYVHYRDLEWRHITVPVEIKGLKDSMQRVLDNRIEQLTKLDFIDPNRKYLNKRELLDLQSRLQSRLRSGPDQQVFKAISLVAEILKVSHAIEITETQGPEALAKYFERLEHEAGSKSGSKASRRLVEDVYMRQAMYALKEMDVTHPKLEIVKDIVSGQLRNNPDSRVIIFTNYRDMSELVTRNLEGADNVRPVRFVGQASKYKDTGLTQKQQVEILDKFRSGEYNALVATSVAEEGLDIPATDLVLFYEPVPSEIRSIQRKGRTGRSHAGKVVVLVAKGTKDEAYYWSSRRKEKTMNSKMRQLSDTRNARTFGEIPGIPGTGMLRTSGTLGTLDTGVMGTSEQLGITGVPGTPEKPGMTGVPEQSEMPGVQGVPEQPAEKAGQKQLLDYSGEKLQIYVDQREIRSGVARALESAGNDVILTTLEVGDYIVSDRVAIERKTDVDFLDSIIDKDRNIFGQLSDLARTYDRPVLIIEGANLYTARQIHPNAIRGVLASIATDFGIPIISTRDAQDTAALIQVIAKREQVDEKRTPSLHGRKTAMTLSEQQKYIISSISNIGPVAARKLLQHFGSVESVMRAGPDELMEVESIGPKTAQRIREVVGSVYKG